MKHKLQGSFFVSAKVVSEHKLLDVNKIHFILANADEKQVLREIFTEVAVYRQKGELAFSDAELIKQCGIDSRFDSADVIVIKRLLQAVLPEQIRNEISTKLFKKFVGVDETVFAHELYLNKDQIALMKQCGMYIGIHGANHYWLGSLGRGQIKADIDYALNEMKEFINPNCWVMNYPYGSYNDFVIDYIKARGCKLALGSNVGVADLKDPKNLFTLSRLDTNDFPPKSENYKQYRG